ncbi:MAG: T9SS type A sorting domain-containing protein [Bacteroidota bacterium]|nr:T9SS type A sorting domain-containing protein [Bacteroidota bacterium]
MKLKSALFITLFLLLCLFENLQGQRIISFRDKHGNTLQAEVDEKTGSAKRIFGLNLNTRQYGYDRSSLTSETVKQLGKRLIDDYEEILKTSSKNVNLKKVDTDGQWWFVEYEQTFAGIPVYSSEAGFTIDPQGNIVTAGAVVFPNISIRTQATVPSFQAMSKVKEEFGSDSATVENEPELFIIPIEHEANYKYYLVWKIGLSSLHPLRDTVYFVSAENGSILKRLSNIRNDVIYGTITGNYYPQRSYDPPIRVAYPTTYIRMYDKLGQDVVSTNADQNGNYSITYSVAYATYYLDINLQNHWIQLRNASDKIIRNTFAFTRASSIRHDYEWPAGDATNVWYHATKIHNFYRGSPFSYTGMDYQMKATVGLGTDRNGAADGTNIFFGSQGGQLWARSSDVVYHEYTHNTIYRIYGGWIGSGGNTQASAMDEGISDYFACTFNNDPLMGEDVLIDRNLNNDTFTWDPDKGPHWNGQVIGGAVWDFREVVSRNVADNLAFKALQVVPRARDFPTYLYNIMVADNGTYNGAHRSQLRTAFAAHSINTTEPLLPPVISGFTQTPSVIYRGGSGTVTAHLSQGNGNISYTWSPTFFPQGASVVSFDENKANIYYGYSKTVSTDDSKIPATTLTCTAINEVGSSTLTTFVYFSSGGGGGCPFVYTWNGNEYIEDNNILPQSVYTPPEEGLVTDYYQLFTEPVETEGKYKLRVGEFEQEISTLDQFKLLIVDHIPEAMVSANDNGEISLYAKPASLTNANVDDGDVYKLVYERDDNYVETEPDQSMQLTFEDGQVGSDKVMLLQASSDLKVPFGALEKLNGKNINPQDIKARKNMSYVWVPVDVQNHKETNIDIGIAWTGTAKLDYIELSNKLNLDYTLHESELISAEHSQDGDVTSLLQNSDGNIVELKPQEWVDLVFTAPPLSEGMKRSFIFVSCGRYVTIPEDKKETQTLSQKGGINENVRTVKLPVSYELFDNHPNPFNPITKISYTIPEPNFVSLKIFDVLGREIATLVAEYQDAGYKTVEFSGVSTNGGLPSGVYFYKLQAGSFISVKKMLLAK